MHDERAWAIISSADPFAFLYWNDAWFDLFSISTNVILAPTVCDNTIPILAFGDILAESTDLAIVSKFCHALTLVGRASCVLDLGPVGQVSLYAFPVYSNSSDASSKDPAASSIAILFNVLYEGRMAAMSTSSSRANSTSALTNNNNIHKLKPTRSKSAAHFTAVSVVDEDVETRTPPRRAKSIS